MTESNVASPGRHLLGRSLALLMHSKYLPAPGLHLGGLVVNSCTTQHEIYKNLKTIYIISWKNHIFSTCTSCTAQTPQFQADSIQGAEMRFGDTQRGIRLATPRSMLCFCWLKISQQIEETLGFIIYTTHPRGPGFSKVKPFTLAVALGSWWIIRKPGPLEDPFSSARCNSTSKVIAVSFKFNGNTIFSVSWRSDL